MVPMTATRHRKSIVAPHLTVSTYDYYQAPPHLISGRINQAVT
jgi:hypothetical protein